MRAPSLAIFTLTVAILVVACVGADEIRLPADAAGLSAGASGLRAGVVRAHKNFPRGPTSDTLVLLGRNCCANLADDLGATQVGS